MSLYECLGNQPISFPSDNLTALYVWLEKTGNSLVVQWLELYAFIVDRLGSISGWGHKLLGS